MNMSAKRQSFGASSGVGKISPLSFVLYRLRFTKVTSMKSGTGTFITLHKAPQLFA